MSNELETIPPVGKPNRAIRTEWKPSERQKGLMTLAQEGSYEKAIVTLCEEAGISNRTYYDWQDNENFQDWWIVSAKKWLGSRLPEVYNSLLKAATTTKGAAVPGSADRKTILELLDKGYASRGRVDVNVTHKINWGQEVNGGYGDVIDAEYTDVLTSDTIQRPSEDQQE